jgi:hypothetical protein
VGLSNKDDGLVFVSFTLSLIAVAVEYITQPVWGAVAKIGEA